MNYILSLLIIGFIHLVHSKIDKDLQTFFKKNKCDQKCTFESGNLTFGTIDLFPSSCETVCADLQLDQRSNLTENELTSVFKNMKHLIGRLKVLNTNYTSGKFLSGLESIECDGNGMLEWGENFKLLEIGLINLTSIICYRVDIWQNFNLTRLNMPNLKILFYPWSKYSLPVKESYIALTFLSTDFCITTNEMATTINVTDYISYKYCEPVLDDKLCKEPVKGCIEIFGDLEITDDTDLEIMKTIEIIYGSLIINGTDIKDFGFLESLKYVASLEKNMEAIIVENNPKLNNITFPRLKKIRSTMKSSIRFTNNNEIISLDPSLCINLRKSMKLDDEYIKINDDNCRLVKIDSDTRDWQKSLQKLSTRWSISEMFLIMILKLL